MRGFRVATVWGIPIRVHVSLLVILPILAWLIGSGAQIETYAGIVNGLAGTTLDPATLSAGNTGWLIGALAAVGLFVSVALHELGHAYVAIKYDLTVESITLWILGGLANLSSIPREWEKEFWIAVAGPAVSVATGLACYALLFVIPASQPIVIFVVGWLAVTNLILAGFNLLPAFPMDGGRILRAILARKRPYAAATRSAARVGTLFAILFAVIGVLGPSPMLLLLALFIYVAATGESRMVQLADLLDGETAGSLAARGEPVDVEDSVAALVTRMFADGRTAYAVTDGDEVVGVVTAADFRALSPAERETTTVGDLVRTDLPRFAADLSAFDALAELDRSRAGAAVVEDAAGGRVLTREDLSRALEFRKTMGADQPF